MNYSDFDSDDYSSNEDEDYVPSDDNLSEDDMKECEKEDALQEDEDVPHPEQFNKKKKIKNKLRKKTKGVLNVNEQEKDGDGQTKAETGGKTSEGNADDTLQTEKSDKLWASFLSDVGSRPKDCTPSAQSQTAPMEERLTPLPLSRHTDKEPKPASVTITKVFDFAGEEVRVSKQVSADSKEAKSYLKNQSTKTKDLDDKVEDVPGQPMLPGPSCKRPAGIGNILGNIGGKKAKMSTLEKSKMDWDAFKSEEGITEELAIHNRGREGYVERTKFLERVDHRQFELEKAVRIINMKQ